MERESTGMGNVMIARQFWTAVFSLFENSDWPVSN